MRAQRPGQEPKSRVFGLLRRPLAAVLRAELFDFVVILGPLLALERNRGLWAELGRARHRERREVWPLRSNGDRGWDIEAGPRHRPIGIRRRRSIAGAPLQRLRGDRLAELDAVRLGLAVGDCRQI